MTYNLVNVLVSTGTHELWETDQENIIIFTRRDYSFIFDKDISKCHELYSYYIQKLSEEDAAEAERRSHYEAEFEPDHKAIKISISDTNESKRASAPAEKKFSDESNVPSAEEICALLERKREEKTFWYKVKKLIKRIFGL